MARFRLAALLLLVGILSPSFALRCSLTDGKGRFTTEECDTFCLVAYAKNTWSCGLFGNACHKLCHAGGCARLSEGDGTALLLNDLSDIDGISDRVAMEVFYCR